MKRFMDHSLSIPECIKELNEFEDLLRSNAELNERDQILPFFRTHLHLASLLSTYIPGIVNPDRIAIEYDVFGDFTCDFIVGDSTKKTFLMVEFEDAKPNSLFVQKGTKATPEWSPRLEHGFSQVLDWFWKVSDVEKTIEYESRFGSRLATIHGIVVVGREQELELREKSRLQWRQDHTIVQSKKVSVITFDQLVRDLKYRLFWYPEAAKADSS
jgi:hypothetical protein